MGMDFSVAGIVPPDDTWLKMKTIYDLCKSTNIKIPNEVLDFFGGEPDGKGQLISIKNKEWNGECGYGVEILVSDIPKSVKYVRFYTYLREGG